MRLILICTLLLVIIFFGSNVLLATNILLWVYIIFLVYNIFRDRYVSIISIFIFGFIYIYFKEIINNLDVLYLDWGNDNVQTAFYVVFLSTITLFSGYYINELIVSTKKNLLPIKKDVSFVIKNKKSFFKITVILTWIIFLGNIVLIYKGFTEGRQNAFEYGILSSFSYAIGVICIVNYKMYFKQYYGRDNYFKVFLYSLPIFILYLGSGTRYLLLYGIIALVSTSLYNLRTKRIIQIAIVVVIFGMISNLFLQMRNSGLAKFDETSSSTINEKKTINQRIVNNFTEEGVFRNAAMINDYTQKNGYTYGVSSSFILYFWVPRTIWKSKPTQIDFWLIRKYTNEYDDTGHSTASGFMGEVFMDFGKYITVFLFFIVGWFLSIINQKLINAKNDSYFKIVVSSAVLAWIFFSVRSILTSSMMFITILILAYLCSKLFKKWNLIK